MDNYMHTKNNSYEAKDLKSITKMVKSANQYGTVNLVREKK